MMRIYIWAERYQEYEERIKAMAAECAWHQTPIGSMQLDEYLKLIPKE